MGVPVILPYIAGIYDWLGQVGWISVFFKIHQLEYTLLNQNSGT